MDKLHARMIIEILGRPPEHIKESLSTLLTKLGMEKGVKILTHKIHEPVPVKDTKDLFTTFMEIEAEFDNHNVCLGIMFAYLPSHIEILSPSSLTLKNDDFSTLCNNLIARIHGYDAVVKRVLGDREILINQIKQLKEGQALNPRATFVLNEGSPKKEKKSKKKSRK